MLDSIKADIESEKSNRAGLLSALGLLLVAGLVIYGWQQREENNLARIARENEEWERRVRAEETRQIQARANAWRDVRAANARWNELFPWMERTTELRQRVLAGAAGVDWLLSDSNPLDPFGLALGAGAIEMTSRVFAQAQAQIQLKWPEVVEVLVEMDEAAGAMLRADAALPGDEAAVAAFERAKEVASRWADDANLMQQVAAQDFFSAGASAARVNETTAELMAALGELMPTPTPSTTGPLTQP